LTGIPRSGTTLCCKLLNQHKDLIALHEPIDPSTIPIQAEHEGAINYIKAELSKIKCAISNGNAFINGDSGGLDIDNPVGNVTEYGVRRVVAKRGEIKLSAPIKDFKLVVKQNALFTALLKGVSGNYPTVCIVRNPVDVFLSWMTVNLPVHRGRLPAGERFCSRLRGELSGTVDVERQIIIYQWFINKFIESNLPVVRYEDIIATSGIALDKALGLPSLERERLFPKKRVFEPKTLKKLAVMSNSILNLKCGQFYSKDDILRCLVKYDLT
jgi:hypothetical protein